MSHNTKNIFLRALETTLPQEEHLTLKRSAYVYFPLVIDNLYTEGMDMVHDLLSVSPNKRGTIYVKKQKDATVLYFLARKKDELYKNYAKTSLLWVYGKPSSEFEGEVVRFTCCLINDKIVIETVAKHTCTIE